MSNLIKRIPKKVSSSSKLPFLQKRFVPQPAEQATIQSALERELLSEPLSETRAFAAASESTNHEFDGEAAWERDWNRVVENVSDDKKKAFLKGLSDYERNIFYSLSTRYACWIDDRNKATGEATITETLWDEADRLAARAIVLYREFGLARGVSARLAMERKHFQHEDIQADTGTFLDGYEAAT